jgi:histidyl-tRNA synthetase
MDTVIKDTCYKGTRILLGNEKRDFINKMINVLNENDFIEIQIPIIQYQELFEGKVGEENNNMMYNFTDRGNRNLCLAPEYTAVIQQLAKTTFKNEKDVRVFYVAECFRGEKPQAGRFRQFTQLGIEILNPTTDYIGCGFYLPNLANELLNLTENKEFKTSLNVTRGLDYYKEGKGFEITCEELGSSKQVCGGGEYEGGVGFALGVDRLINLIKDK